MHQSHTNASALIPYSWLVGGVVTVVALKEWIPKPQCPTNSEAGSPPLPLPLPLPPGAQKKRGENRTRTRPHECSANPLSCPFLLSVRGVAAMAATSPGGGALCAGSTGGPGAGPDPGSGPGGSAGSQQRTVVSVSAGGVGGVGAMQSVHSSINYSKVCFAFAFCFLLCLLCFDFAFCFLSFF